ncbi:diphthine synthase, partial [mine drainage metagenome]
GLQPYRFGRVVSLPFPAPGFAPRSPFEQVAANRARDLHTLVLLDLRPDEGRYLSATAALRAFADARPPFSADLAVAVAARVGRADAAGWFGPLGILAGLDFGPPLHAVVVPASLHFEEAEALERFRVR